MKHLFSIYGMCGILWLGACTPVATQPEESLFTTQEDFPNLLNVKNVPEQAVEGDLNLFSDLGAWSGYAGKSKQGICRCFHRAYDDARKRLDCSNAGAAYADGQWRKV